MDKITVHYVRFYSPGSFCANVFPPYPWYLVAERAMQALGWLQ